MPHKLHSRHICSLLGSITQLSISDGKSSRTSWPRGQNFVLGLRLGLEELSLASASSICLRHVLELLFWPCENECNDGTANHCEFAMIFYQSYLLAYLVLLIQTSSSSRSREYLTTQMFIICILQYFWLSMDSEMKIVLSLEDLSSDSKLCPRLTSLLSMPLHDTI